VNKMSTAIIYFSNQANFNVLIKRVSESVTDAIAAFHSKEGSGVDPVLTLTHSFSDVQKGSGYMAASYFGQVEPPSGW